MVLQKIFLNLPEIALADLNKMPAKPMHKITKKIFISIFGIKGLLKAYTL